MARKAGISLKTIAEATGVSVVTVSRALNRDFLVDPQTAQRVQDAADKLGYKLPSQERRSVRVSKGNISDKPLKTGRLAFIIPDNVPDGLNTPLSRGIQKGAKDYLFERKIELVNSYLDNGRHLPDILAKKEVDGYILRGNFSEIGLTKAQLPQMRRFPHISIFGIPPIKAPKSIYEVEDYILPDDRLIGRMGLDSLIEQGSKAPLLISTLSDKTSRVAAIATFSRRNGFMYEAYRRDVPYKELEIVDLDSKKIVTKLKQYLRRSPAPDGIFLTRAFPEMIEALQSVGLTGSQDVPLYTAISGDNDPCHTEGVTGINLRPEALGKAAAELLLWRINHPELESKSLLIPPASA